MISVRSINSGTGVLIGGRGQVTFSRLAHYLAMPTTLGRLMKPALPLALAIAALSASAAHAQPYPINPGFWEAHTTFMGLIGSTDRYCIKPKDINKFLAGPSNHIYRCTYPDQVTADGKIHFKGSCVQTKHGKVVMVIDLEGDGAYTPTTVRMRANGSTHMLGLPVSGSAAVDGHFISADCPADAKSFKE
jgi:hypothetical protein